jgi:putative membrane protein
MAALAELPLPSMEELMLIGVLAAVFAYLITVYLSRSAQCLAGFGSRNMNRAVIIFVTALCTILTGPFGIFILVLSTLVGLVPTFINVPRVYGMGSIMLPVILYSFGIAWV